MATNGRSHLSRLLKSICIRSLSTQSKHSRSAYSWTAEAKIKQCHTSGNIFPSRSPSCASQSQQPICNNHQPHIKYFNRRLSTLKTQHTFTHKCLTLRELCGIVQVAHQPVTLTTGWQQVRHKSKGKKSDSSDSDEDSEEDELDDDDYEAPTNFKKMQIYLKSLRADAVVSSALDISRNRVDEIFYESRLLLNGEKLLKKSKQLDEGDYVDLVTERLSEEDQLLVKRVKILETSSERTSKDKMIVTVKVWKSPFRVEDTSKSEWK